MPTIESIANKNENLAKLTLDEVVDFSNPNYEPTDQMPSEALKGENKSDKAFKPDDTTMDKAPSKASTGKAKDSLARELEAIAMDDAEVVSEPDEEVHKEWEKKEIEKNIPDLPESLGGNDKPDENGLVYLTFDFTVDPSKYRSPNYQPINDAAMAGSKANEMLKGNFAKKEDGEADEADSIEAGGEEEPSKGEEQAAAKEANKEEKKEEEGKGTEDAAVEAVVMDYATFIDGSSFLCDDVVNGIDYSKIAMDAGPKKAPTKQTCKTTFSQCRAKNPLFCRFHGPKLLEKDIKTAISNSLGKGCTIAVTKDKGQKDPMKFRLTIGCPPSMKKNVEQIVHMFMTQNPGISSSEDYKDLGNGKETAEFEMDVLKADEPPKKNDTKGQAAAWEAEKAIAGHKKMAVVGDTPSSIEKQAGEGGLTGEEAEKDQAKQMDAEIGKLQKKMEKLDASVPEDENTKEAKGQIANEFFEATQKQDLEGMKAAMEKMKALGKQFKKSHGEQTQGEAQNEDPDAEKGFTNGESGDDDEWDKVNALKAEFYNLPEPEDADSQWEKAELTKKFNHGLQTGNMDEMQLAIDTAKKLTGDSGSSASSGDSHYTIKDTPNNNQKGVHVGGQVGVDEWEFNQVVDNAMNKGYFNDDDFVKKYDMIYNGDDESTWEEKTEQLKKLVAEKDGKGTLPSVGEGDINTQSGDDFEASKKAYDDAIKQYGLIVDSLAPDVVEKVQEHIENAKEAIKNGDSKSLRTCIEGINGVIDSKIYDACKGIGEKLGLGDDSSIDREAYKYVKSHKDEVGLDHDGSLDFHYMDGVAKLIGHLEKFAKSKNATQESQQTTGKSEVGGGTTMPSQAGSEEYKQQKQYLQDTQNDVDKLFSENPHVFSANYNLGVLHEDVLADINYCNLSLDGEEELHAKMDQMNADSTSDNMAKMALAKAIVEAHEQYEQAKSKLNNDMESLNKHVDKAKKSTIGGAKDAAANHVQEVVGNMTKQMFPRGAPEGINSVIEYCESLEQGLEQDGMSDEDKATLEKAKEKAKFHEAMDAVKAANDNFAALMAEIEQKIEGATDIDSMKGLDALMTDVESEASKMTTAFAGYKLALGNVKKEMKDAKDVEAMKKAKVEKMKSIKEKVAAMTPQEKLLKIKEICEKKLKKNPNDEATKKMLKKVLATMKKSGMSPSDGK